MPLSLSSPFSRVVQAIRGASAAASSSHAAAGQALVQNDSPAGLQERLGNDWAAQKWESLSAAQQAKVEADHRADLKELGSIQSDEVIRVDVCDSDKSYHEGYNDGHDKGYKKAFQQMGIISGIVACGVIVATIIGSCRRGNPLPVNQEDGNQAGGDGPDAPNDGPPAAPILAGQWYQLHGGNQAGGDGPDLPLVAANPVAEGPRLEGENARPEGAPAPEAAPVAAAPLPQPIAPLPEGGHVSRLEGEAARSVSPLHIEMAAIRQQSLQRGERSPSSWRLSPIEQRSASPLREVGASRSR